MLSNFLSIKHGTYGFRFKGSHQQRIAGIHSLGWERRVNTDYNYDGLARAEVEVIVFQYTLKGAGEIRCYQAITDDLGHVLKLNFYASPMTHIFEFLKKVSNGELPYYIKVTLHFNFLH